MVKQFLRLEWKAFFRSASFGKSLGIKILMSFFALYFMVMFLFIGFFMDKILKEVYPNLDPLVAFGSFIFFWVLGDLIIRFFFQKLPVMSVKPLLILPVRRKFIVNYVLGKSVLSFINFLPLFAVVPFCIKLIYSDYDVITVLVWLVTIIILILINNFLNFIIESKSVETELSFLPIILLVGGFYSLNYFEIINISDALSKGVISICENPVFILVPTLILILLYAYNFKILKQKLF
ncbi:DUF5687 family protein [Thalassobellus suaedae]|uniref:DUF5687 family protein n=1 Tax=Thalassobellus suaedae TaxID=3074124 RepID=A0ABY9XRL4_9FLAO|nr:DUF5687 family protein [Flavobacteriaceae bacterium HL-DH14]